MRIEEQKMELRHEARTLVRQGALLLDVRTPEEFAAGHIEGARNIPLAELGQRMHELGKPTHPVVVYCRSGGRSAQAGHALTAAGYQVTDLGAMGNW